MTFERYKSPYLFAGLGIFLIVLTIIIIAIGPIPQDNDYHNFADNRTILGIQNFWNVISNVPFAIVGIIGINMCFRYKLEGALFSWGVFFTGILFVPIGSAYYHLFPNNQTLVWDRLPMTISFMALFAALLSEAIDLNLEKKILIPSLIIGIASVVYWVLADDLRPYGVVQFGTLAALPFIYFFSTLKYPGRDWLMYGLVFYISAKVFELADSAIFSLFGGAISGHSLKHVVAAASTFAIFEMLKSRRLELR
ncbi:MAG: ceramidase domain-containing protein [Methylococcales bacterium]